MEPKAPSSPHVVRRAAILSALMAFGLPGSAAADPEHHLVFFYPSPSASTVGYVLHLGTSSGEYTQQVDLGQPSEPQDMLVYSTNIDTATDLYVALTSYNGDGLESSLSNEHHLAAAVVTEPGEEPAPPPEPETDPEPDAGQMEDAVVDSGSGTSLRARHALANLAITSDVTGLLSMVRGDGTSRALTVDSLSAARDLRPTRCDLDDDGDSDLVLGFGPGSDGQVALIHLEDEIVSSVESIVIGDADYHTADGQTHPACGDIDGDGLNELVIGTGPAGGAQLFTFDSFDTAFAPFDGERGSVIDAPTSGGMRSPGTSTLPALGDFDGDGLDELVVGYSAAGHRSIAVLDDGLHGFARHESLESGNGLIRIARVNDDDSRGGGTYPALGDWDGDGLDEFAIGYGAGSGSWILFMDDAVHARLDRYPGYLGVQVGRPDVRAADMTVRPAFGDIDGDGRDEMVVSFGDTGSHEVQVFEDQFTGSTNLFRGGEGFVEAAEPGQQLMAAPER